MTRECSTLFKATVTLYRFQKTSILSDWGHVLHQRQVIVVQQTFVNMQNTDHQWAYTPGSLQTPIGHRIHGETYSRRKLRGFGDTGRSLQITEVVFTREFAFHNHSFV